MQCPACGNEKYRVRRQPRRARRTELRSVECTECETKYTLVATIESISILNPETMQRFDLPIEKFNEGWMNYLLGRGKYPGTGKEC